MSMIRIYIYHYFGKRIRLSFQRKKERGGNKPDFSRDKSS